MLLAGVMYVKDVAKPEEHPANPVVNFANSSAGLVSHNNTAPHRTPKPQPPPTSAASQLLALPLLQVEERFRIGLA